MRWYCVLCFRASPLKNSTLRLQGNGDLYPFIPKDQIFGRRKKVGNDPKIAEGSSVYLIFSLINTLPFSPIASSIDSNDILPVGKPDRKDPSFHPAKTVVTLLARTV